MNKVKPPHPLGTPPQEGNKHPKDGAQNSPPLKGWQAQPDGVVPKLRFLEFRDKGEWGSEFGDVVFDQISNKDHNSNLPVLAITQEQGAVPRDLIDYHVSVTDKSIESYKVVEVGDFIISLRSFQGGIEYSSYKGICSPAYVILRLKLGYSADYFRHFLKTDRFIGMLTKNLEGLRDGKMVSYKQFSELQLPTPSKVSEPSTTGLLPDLNFRMLRTFNTEVIKHEYGSRVLDGACSGGRAGSDSSK